MPERTIYLLFGPQGSGKTKWASERGLPEWFKGDERLVCGCFPLCVSSKTATDLWTAFNEAIAIIRTTAPSQVVGVRFVAPGQCPFYAGTVRAGEDSGEVQSVRLL
jgi:hypothetical protein